MPRKKKLTGNFNDMLLNIFEEEKVILEEGVISITPFVAFSAFKKKAINSLRRSKAFKTTKKIKEVPSKVKAKAELGVEKTRATLGIQSGTTVYKLTKEQMDVMGDVYSKYGKDLVDEILDFRRNVLAPYQLIKRKINRSSRVSGKEITGLSKEEYRSALESGRKKIQNRGVNFTDKSGSIQNSVGETSTQLDDLNKLKKNIAAGKINYNVANKVFRKFDVGDDFGDYSREELRKIYDDIMKNYKSLVKASEDLSTGKIDYEKNKALLKKSRDLWKGKTIDLTQAEKSKFYNQGNFNAALGKYFFSRDIMSQLTQQGIFKKTYLSIIDEMIERSKKRNKGNLQKLISLRKNINFTDKEKKVWGKLSTVKNLSGNLEDYYQKLKDGDFPEGSIKVQRSEELVDAEQKIENAVRRFERRLKNVVDAKDYTELKRLRLIGNLISISELRDPKTLFKSAEEIKNVEGDSKKETYMSIEEYKKRLKEIATIEYDKISELENAKKEAISLAKKMRDQGDAKAVTDNKDLLRQIKIRRTTETKNITGHKYDAENTLDVDDIENLIKEILQRDYTSMDKLKQDKQRLNTVMEKYKKQSPEDAEKNLKEIGFLFARVDRKIATQKDKLE